MAGKKSSPKSDRAIVFIDWSNVYLAAKKDYAAKVDPLALRTYLSGLYNVVHFHYFSSEDSASPGQVSFHSMLKRNGFIVHKRELVERQTNIRCATCGTVVNAQCPTCRKPVFPPAHKSKMIDIELAVTLVVRAATFDVGVLVTGDRDFLPAIEWLRHEQGKKIDIVSFKSALSHELRAGADQVLFLDSVRSQIFQKQK